MSKTWPRRIIGSICAIAGCVMSMPAFAQTATTIFSTYIGGSTDQDSVRDVDIDSSGNFYLTGGSSSPDFPVTAGSHDNTHNGSYDAFVTKLDPSGALLWSTWIGGANYDRAYGIEVDDLGNVIVAGRAGSGFPTTAGVLQPNFAGDSMAGPRYGTQDGFVCKLSSAGVLQFCTYFGDSGSAIVRDLDVDSSGNIYVASVSDEGETYAPAIAQSMLNSPVSGRDALIAKISPDGTQVYWARHEGGNADESGTNSIRVDAAGNPYLLYTTFSTGLGTVGAYDTSFAGLQDAFVARFDPAGTLIWGSYIGGPGLEVTETHELTVTPNGHAIVALATQSLFGAIPDSPSTIRRTFGPGGGINDILIARLSTDGSTLDAVALVGGSDLDRSEGVTSDSAGNLFFTGTTTSPDFPIVGTPLQPVRNRDAVAVALGPTLDLLYSSPFGGSGSELGRGAAVSDTNLLLFTGSTDSTNLPTTNPFQPALNGTSDSFVAAIQIAGLPGAPPTSLTRAQQACVNEMNKNGAKVNKAQLRENERCLKDFQREKLSASMTFDACTTADRKGKVRKAEQRTAKREAKKCGPPNAIPPFAYTNAATVNAAAVDGALTLAYEIFGGSPVLDANLATKAADKATAKCQLEMLKRADRIENTVLKEVNKAKKKALKDESVDSAAALEVRLQAVFSSNRRINSARDRLVKRVDRRCAGLQAPDAIFPGYDCAKPNPNLSEVEACAIAASRCEACVKINTFDALSLNCDLADDLNTNGSCP
jgi:hypothetical protein